MGYFSKLVIAHSLFFSLGLYASPPSSCARILLLVEQSRVRVAAEIVLAEWERRQEQLPILHDDPEKSAHSMSDEDQQWLFERIGNRNAEIDEVNSFLISSNFEPKFYGSESAPAVSSFNDVTEFKVNGRKQIFRPLLSTDSLSKVRRTYAASRLNQLMGLETVPVAHLAVVEDDYGPAFGVVSEFVSGSNKSGRTTNARSLSDARGFEFLISNVDVLEDDSRLNIRFLKDGRVCALRS